MSKEVAFESGDISTLYPDLDKLLDESSEGLQRGPSSKNQYTFNYEHIINSLLEGKNYKVILDKEHYKIFIEGEVYDLTEILAKYEPRYVVLNPNASKQYANYLKDLDKDGKPISDGPLWKPKQANTNIIADAQYFEDEDTKGEFAELEYGHKAAINVYTQDPYYRDMNGLERGFKIYPANDPDLSKKMKEVLIHNAMCNKGLALIPNRETKISYRYDGALPPKILQDKINHKVTFIEGFFSTAADMPVATFKGPYCTCFVGTVGKNVGPLSYFKTEREILVPPTQAITVTWEEENGKYYFLTMPVNIPIGLRSEQPMGVEINDPTNVKKIIEDNYELVIERFLTLISQLHSDVDLSKVNKTTAPGKQIVTQYKKKLSKEINDLAKELLADKTKSPDQKFKEITQAINNMDKRDRVLKREYGMKTPENPKQKTRPTLKKMERMEAWEASRARNIGQSFALKEAVKSEKTKRRETLNKELARQINQLKELEKTFLNAKYTVNNPLFQFMDVIKHVYNEYLSKPYDDTIKNKFAFDWDLQVDPNNPNDIIQRPNHGLAHTLRSAFLIPIIAQYYAQKDPKFNFTMQDIQKMQVAMLFFVTGRKSDLGWSDDNALYAQFRKASAQAFEDYCNNSPTMQELFGSEISKYSALIENFGKKDPIIGKMFYLAHCLDLQRCKDANEFASYEESFKKELGADRAKELIEYARELLKDTGDRIMTASEDYHIADFAPCSRDPQYCLHTLAKTSVPSIDKAVTDTYRSNLPEIASDKSIKKPDQPKPTGFKSK